jgi:hypothetical protein
MTDNPDQSTSSPPERKWNPLSQEINWSDALRTRFLSKPGEHAIEIGITGSGKTQGLYHLLNGIMQYSKDETILWISCGKSAEELKLMQFGKTNFIFPKNRSLDIQLKQPTYPYISYEANSIPDIFRHINRGMINVLCLASFYPDPDEYSVVVTEFFKALITMARDGTLPTPLAVFIDEFQMVAPAQGQALSDQHAMCGRWMQKNIDQLRSIGVRIVGAAQSWKRVRQGVRNSFGIIIIRQGAEFTTDITRLMKQNEVWQGLPKDGMVVAFRNRMYSDPLLLPSYGDGTAVGTIEYLDFTNRQRVDERNIDEVLDSMKKKGKKVESDPTE